MSWLLWICDIYSNREGQESNNDHGFLMCMLICVLKCIANNKVDWGQGQW